VKLLTRRISLQLKVKSHARTCARM